MGRKAGRIATRPQKWLTAVSGPVCLVVELLRVPDSLKQDLRNTNGVR